MLSKTKKYYNSTRLGKSVAGTADDADVPITFIHVFHKEYPRLSSIPLPSIENSGSELETLLELRESSRNFAQKPVSLEDLGSVLQSCRIVDVARDPERRSYPSGGARFPVEMYVVSYNVSGLEKGAYHYSMKKNCLELLWQKDLQKEQRDIISPYLNNPAATILFTSVIARSEVKYGLRSFPYSLIEAGHMGQNVHLKCAEMGIGSCSVSGFIDEEVEKVLDLTADEIPIYSISLGWKKRT